MLSTTVVNATHQQFDIYIGRETSFRRVANMQAVLTDPMVRTIQELGEQGAYGNPFHMKDESQREDVIAKYKRRFWHRVNNEPGFYDLIKDLEGYRLGCFCDPKPCHGHIIVAWLMAGCPLKERSKR